MNSLLSEDVWIYILCFYPEIDFLYKLGDLYNVGIEFIRLASKYISHYAFVYECMNHKCIPSKERRKILVEGMATHLFLNKENQVLSKQLIALFIKRECVWITHDLLKHNLCTVSPTYPTFVEIAASRKTADTIRMLIFHPKADHSEENILRQLSIVCSGNHDEVSILQYLTLTLQKKRPEIPIIKIMTVSFFNQLLKQTHICFNRSMHRYLFHIKQKGIHAFVKNERFNNRYLRKRKSTVRIRGVHIPVRRFQTQPSSSLPNNMIPHIGVFGD